MKHFLLHGRHIPYLMVLQVIFIVLFAFFVDYGTDADSQLAFNATDTSTTNSLQSYYPSRYPISHPFYTSWKTLTEIDWLAANCWTIFLVMSSHPPLFSSIFVFDILDLKLFCLLHLTRKWKTSNWIHSKFTNYYYLAIWDAEIVFGTLTIDFCRPPSPHSTGQRLPTWTIKSAYDL